MTAAYSHLLFSKIDSSLIAEICMIFLHEHPEFASVKPKVDGCTIILTGTLNYQGEIAFMRDAYEGKP